MTIGKRKKLTAVLLALCLLLGMTACGGGGNADENDEHIDRVVDDLMGMSPVYCAYSLLATENPQYQSTDYDRNFWKLEYYLTMAYGTNNGDIIFDLSGIQVPYAVAEEYGRALFSDFGSLPALPEGVSIKYDRSIDSYILPWGESMVRTDILGVDMAENGNYVVDTQLFDLSAVTSDITENEERIPGVCMRFELAYDDKADENSIFKFRVVSSEVLESPEIGE